MYEDNGGYMHFGSCFSKRVKFILIQSIFLCLVLFQLNKVLRKVQRELYLRGLNQSFIYVRKADLPGSGETRHIVMEVLILTHRYLDVPCQRCLSSLCIPSSNYLAWLCFFSWTAEIYYYRAVELGSILQTTVF